ncbi:Uncharacterised protein [Sebaldella termitidis]|uniref:Uncharacterized protein n=1 Tax=Sebaldella termitidis (strain ATCC 33386 / NCTC 11300) TaxID=526218 RepID=D1AS29_SEBTE|nr:hypothetical protein [Sebaldella termitidis]ACZ11016.1 conserved hypothetical protein [Sebaldella termitidis ATCC 33386]SUI81433.1 Uncharacterised protein [Sebaldella termitidis]
MANSRDKYSDKDILNQLKDHCKRNGKITKKREKKYTIAELIGKYRRLRKKEKYKNSEITMEDFCRETFINSKLIIDIFETWEDFCEMSTIIHWQKITIYNT